MMAILTRLTRLLTADVHAVLDRLEEPQAQLQQAMREMQDLIAATQSQLGRLEQQGAHFDEQGQRLTQKLQANRQELDLCLQADEEALARNLIRQRLSCERAEQSLAQAQTLNQRQQAQRQVQLQSFTRQFEELEQQAQLFANQVQASPDRPIADTSGGSSVVTEADVDVALLAERQRQVQA